MHIDDVASAVMLGVDLMSRRELGQHLVRRLIAHMNTQMQIWIGGMPMGRVLHSGDIIRSITNWHCHTVSIRP